MNVLVVYAHHEPGSLTAALKNIAVSVLQRQGHTVTVSDLYGSNFQAVAQKYDMNQLSGKHFNYMLEQRNAASLDWDFSPDIVEQLQKVKEADVILFYSPVWWFSVPAILKGWFDRVLVMGVAWDGGRTYEAGLLRGKTAMLSVIAGGPREYYQPLNKHRATMKQILHPINHGTLAFCGLDVLEPFVVYESMSMTPDQYKAVLEQHQSVIENLQVSPQYLSKF